MPRRPPMPSPLPPAHCQVVLYPACPLPLQLLPAEVAVTPSGRREPGALKQGLGQGRGTGGPPLPALSEAPLPGFTVASAFNAPRSCPKLRNRFGADGTRDRWASPSGKVPSLCLQTWAPGPDPPPLVLRATCVSLSPSGSLEPPGLGVPLTCAFRLFLTLNPLPEPGDELSFALRVTHSGRPVAGPMVVLHLPGTPNHSARRMGRPTGCDGVRAGAAWGVPTRSQGQRAGTCLVL